jgi:Ca-activated chloride channel family protein
MTKRHHNEKITMKKLTTVFIAAIFSLTVFGQSQKVKGNLSTADTADLTILNIYPDSFPNVAVVFKAETRKGEPVWNLTKEKMKVKENSQNCEVISLEQISKNKPINLGIVIDHSGSMMEDISQLYDKDGMALYTFDANFNPVLPIGYTSPIDNAKKAVKSFVTSFDSKKDFISITGFSNTVDRKLSLTQNIGEINSMVDSMQADFSTALYDAMITSINEIKNSNGVKVLVVLTDGQDNSSKSKWNDVVDKAIKEDIPIYIIGLGNVNKDTLQLIAKSTKGQFYFTYSSSSLNTVYAAISKQVQAFYNLVYSSPNFSSADSTRQIELSFDIDSIFLVTNPETLNLPSEVVAFIEKKERQKEYLIYGGIATAILIAAGAILFYYHRKKKDQPTIKKLFPNPSNGSINLDFVSGSGQLQIINLSGQVAKTIEINSNEAQFDISDLQDGNYIAVIHSNGQQSNGMKFILQR